jgi:hypothetical protein
VDGIHHLRDNANKGIPMSSLVDHPTKDLTYSIIGAAMAVHNAIGPG